MQSTKPPPSVNCPNCGRPVLWSAASPHRPFCSPRCRQIDLGAWAEEKYRVPAQEDPDDPPDGDTT
jgi:endogenous inhibitor of DNA gyrase (YacG/DUF329 family)